MSRERAGCWRFGWGRAFDSGSKLRAFQTLARNFSAPPAGDGAALAESTLLFKAGKISPFRACTPSANLSKRTSNERLCLCINDFVPK
jgi:hypothetical protein